MQPNGGTTEHPGVKVYLLLAVKSGDEAAGAEVTERFTLAAKYTNDDIGAEVVELTTNHRMRDKLSGSEAGKGLYERIWTSAPVICVSTNYIGHPGNADNVELLRFADYEQSPEKMFMLIDSKMTTASASQGFIEWLKRLNQVLVLRPAVFGLGVDLNKIIGEYLAKRR